MESYNKDKEEWTKKERTLAEEKFAHAERAKFMEKSINQFVDDVTAQNRNKIKANQDKFAQQLKELAL